MNEKIKSYGRSRPRDAYKWKERTKDALSLLDDICSDHQGHDHDYSENMHQHMIRNDLISDDRVDLDLIHIHHLQTEERA
jgi:hypothetical protein